MFRNLWVIPAGLLAMVVGLIYLRFLRHLQRETRRVFVISGILFIAGAVGMEMIGARFSSHGLRAGAWFAVLVTIEELLEWGASCCSCTAFSGMRKQRLARWSSDLRRSPLRPGTRPPTSR
jgi:hypothetical protein